ncbi:hypothetical protein C5Y96_15380 [Blastopirellula marina]|uniref:Nucleotidyltransferase n=1 Tax=Blastopirellula marina TaxID=124 RepID=A0A2S8FB24_9BACT|nr:MULTISPECIES: hypothetical protein [Pirellulaceae]PQO29134.1 hypothetical protein C5Y96_15380 [Blastopirellula marina]RCS50325.1 hypothetical protein DTL36_15390 [Bremerella cremea]
MNTSNDLIVAVSTIIAALDSLHIPFFIGGSVASSYHGVPRSTIDIDLVADIKEEHAKPFFSQVATEFYADETTIRKACLDRSCFNLIHLGTGFKVDIFVNQNREFDRSAFARATKGALDECQQVCVPIASPEDIILAKLLWYREGNEVSERQWNDVSMLARNNREQLDQDYLRVQAVQLKVVDLLDRLFAEVKIGNKPSE